MAMIETHNLSKSYNGFDALKSLSLKVDQGDIFGFIGPNGAGKTTTLRILATLLTPSSGSAYINGVNVKKSPYEIKKIVGFMPDSFGVYDGMRLREYLDFFGAAYKIPVRKRRQIIEDVLELTDLTSRADDFVSAFSRGMKQRCCLAKTLIHDPKVLLLDEPASGLDPRARIEIRELLKTLRDMGKTILISSHILSELGDMCNKIAIIEHGTLLAAGDFHEIMEGVHAERELRVSVLSGGELAEEILTSAEGITRFERSGNEMHMKSTLPRPGLSALLKGLMDAGVEVVFFSQDKETLEDVFMHVTKGGI